MSRKGYISDNLYDMRDRFKRNHAEHNVAAATKDPSDAVEHFAPEAAELRKQSSAASPVASPVAAPDEQHCVPAATLPRLHTLNAAGQNGGYSRELRDLEGRLLRDLSFSEAELEKYSRKLKSVEGYRSTVTELLEELQKLDSGEPDSSSNTRAVDALRIKYFHAAGRFESENSTLPAPAAASMADSSNAPLKISQWPLALAIISAAVIVALTMFFIFGS